MTLNRFFTSVDKVLLVRINYERLSQWKKVQWDPTESHGVFAHLYAPYLTGDMVDLNVSLLPTYL